MMGEPQGRQDRLFYDFCLEDRVPADHPLRRIDAVLDLAWLRVELAPFYSPIGRPSIDPPPVETACRARRGDDRRRQLPAPSLTHPIHTTSYMLRR